MNYEALKELAAELKVVSDEIDRLAEHGFDLAESILDFERGLLTLPELIERAKEILK